MPCYICGFNKGLSEIGPFQVCQTHRLQFGSRRRARDQGKPYTETLVAMRDEYRKEHEGVRDE